MRPLGKTQRSCLGALSKHNNGAWWSGCGWLWDNYSGTVRILNSLVKRELVSYEDTLQLKGFAARRDGIWRITEQGKKELKS